MSHPALLIAAREFRTYVATASFWIALAIGPLLMGGALLLTAGLPKPPTSASLTLVRDGTGARATFSDNFPLSEAGRRAVATAIAHDGRLTGPITVQAPATAKLDAAAVSRLALVVMLWLTLVGSLGMLLQAVVRERATRALESLLAAARPIDIVLGKLAGVGAVSVLVLVAWLGSAALGARATEAGGQLAVLLRGFADPAAMARAGLIYLLGFAFYGLVTVAVGAMARDNADAQNRARPMFAVLLAVFFTVAPMAQHGAGGLAWLAYAPPFTPFILLMSPPSTGVDIFALGLLAAAVFLAGLWAAHVLKVERAEFLPKLRR
jgi:ABC-2 type transport system permease protein